MHSLNGLSPLSARNFWIRNVFGSSIVQRMSTLFGHRVTKSVCRLLSKQPRERLHTRCKRSEHPNSHMGPTCTVFFRSPSSPKCASSGHLVLGPVLSTVRTLDYSGRTCAKQAQDVRRQPEATSTRGVLRSLSEAEEAELGMVSPELSSSGGIDAPETVAELAAAPSRPPPSWRSASGSRSARATPTVTAARWPR